MLTNLAISAQPVAVNVVGLLRPSVIFYNATMAMFKILEQENVKVAHPNVVHASLTKQQAMLNVIQWGVRKELTCSVVLVRIASLIVIDVKLMDH